MLRHQHQKEAEAFFASRGLSMSSLMNPVMPNPTTVSPPIFMEAMSSNPFQLPSSHAHVSTANPEGMSGAAGVRQGLAEGGVNPDGSSPEKPRRLFKLEDMLKYADFSRAPQVGGKPEVKKSLNELKYEKDLKGWELPSTADPATGAGAQGGAKPPSHEQPDQQGEECSESHSRRSSIDLSASQNSIPEVVRQQQQQPQQFVGGGMGLLPPAQSQYGQQPMAHQQQQMSQQMNQLSAMFGSSAFPYFYGYYGPYSTFSATGSQGHHTAFPPLKSNTFVMPMAPQQGGVQSQPMASAGITPTSGAAAPPAGPGVGGPSSGNSGVAAPIPNPPPSNPGPGGNSQPGATG